MVDYQGISLIIGALGITIPSVVAAYIAVRAQARLERIENKTDVIKTHVDGLNQMIATGAHAEGKAEGIATERAKPMVPAATKPKAPK